MSKKKKITLKQLKYKRSKKLPRNRNIKFQADGPVDQLSHVGVRYHKDYVYDQLRFTVLTYTQMHPVDRALVEGTLKVINTGPQAMTLPKLKFKDGNEHNRKAENIESNGWSTEKLDQFGRVLLVSYRGVECALLFKRQLTELKLNPGDRQPEGVMQDPIDAWQRLDLFGASAKRANYVLTKEIEQLKTENKLQASRIETLEALNDQLEHTVKVKEQARDEAVKKLSKKRRKK